MEALATVRDSAILTILVSLWLAVFIAVAICNKIGHIHKCVQKLRALKEEKTSLLSPSPTHED